MWKMNQSKKQTKLLNCPKCKSESTLWGREGEKNAKCLNEECNFVGNVLECQNKCGNVSRDIKTDFQCYRCMFILQEYSFRK